jgi:hypothetical protein
VIRRTRGRSSCNLAEANATRLERGASRNKLVYLSVLQHCAPALASLAPLRPIAA